MERIEIFVVTAENVVEVFTEEDEAKAFAKDFYKAKINIKTLSLWQGSTRIECEVSDNLWTKQAEKLEFSN